MVLYVNGGVQDLAEMHQLYPRAGEWSEAAGLAHQMANRVEWPELLGVEAETARGEYHLHEYHLHFVPDGSLCVTKTASL